MGQKVHPLGFRLGINQKHQSYWCVKPKLSSLWIQDASFLRNFLEKTYIDAGITKIEILRRNFDFPSILIKIYAARSVIILKKNKDKERLQNELATKLKAFYRKRKLPDFDKFDISLDVTQLNKPNLYAIILAENMVKQLQQRKPFRKVMHQTIQKALNSGAKGIKVQVAGRLNGADMARVEYLQKGPVPLQTLRARIDYSSKSAKTISGLLGVKVWVFHGERLVSLSNF